MTYFSPTRFTYCISGLISRFSSPTINLIKYVSALKCFSINTLQERTFLPIYIVYIMHWNYTMQIRKNAKLINVSKTSKTSDNCCRIPNVLLTYLSSMISSTSQERRSKAWHPSCLIILTLSLSDLCVVMADDFSFKTSKIQCCLRYATTLPL